MRLELRSVCAGYGRARVLFDVGLEARAGEVVALLGRNGAGKSTTLKAIMGLVPLQSGSVILDGRDVGRHETHELARLGLGYVPEERRIFTDLTLAENLEVGRRPPRGSLPAWTEERLFSLFPALAPMRTRPGARMSGGEQQMLSIARTLAGNPGMVLLDEPSEGLAPMVVEQVARAIVAMKEAGVGVLLAEQSRHFAGRLADRAYVLEKGIIRKA